MKDFFTLLLFLSIFILGGWLVSEVAISGSWTSFITEHMPEAPTDYGC